MTLAERLAALPAPRTIPGARRAIRDALIRSRSKLVVIDDDPTGTQTVHGVRVFMDWSVQTLRSALARAEPLFYVSTNSRSMSRADAEALAHDVGRNLRTAAEQNGIQVVVASRSDSTLRGHFPAEVDALVSELSGPRDGVILVPAFFDAGRYTIDNIHWVEIDGELVPAHETEFARDPDFGFEHGDLREWIQEKTNGAVPSDTVICISLEQVRRDVPDRVAAILEHAHGGNPIVANAACDEDLEVLALAVMAAEQRGKKFIYRTGASFVKVRGGVEDRPLLTRSEVKPGPGPGLVVAGSSVARTTAQIDRLVEARRASPVEISAALLLSGSTHQQEVGRVTRAVSDALARGVSVLVYTTRGVANAPISWPQAETSCRDSARWSRESSGGRASWWPREGLRASRLPGPRLDARRRRCSGRSSGAFPCGDSGPDRDGATCPMSSFPATSGTARRS